MRILADIEDYISGKILRDTKLAFFLLKFVRIPVIGSLIRRKLLEKVKKFEAMLVDIHKAAELLQESKKCAVGERVCRILYPSSKVTESVFIDELAEGMVSMGKAKFVTKEEAIKTLKKYNSPLIVSKVSGKYLEFCRSFPKKCVYWNMERRGLRCLSKNKKND